MRKYITLFFSASLFLLSCKGNKAPDGIINHKRMVDLLMEVHIMDGRMYSVRQEPDSLYKYGLGKYYEVFKRFHTDTLQFRKSVQYYTTQPDEMQAMYDEILLKLKAKSDSINKAQLKQNNAIPKK